jgi:hypothetical protein
VTLVPTPRQRKNTLGLEEEEEEEEEEKDQWAHC